jgi:CBS domain-containing protein
MPLPHPGALGAYLVLGLLIGGAAVAITRLVYAIEEGFERLPIHWMWWPALGGLVVGLVGLYFPNTLGVGYDNIEGLLSLQIAGQAAFWLCLMKLVSWSMALGSGTSGGTLAPLFTLGAALGSLMGTYSAAHWPGLGVDPRIAALVGMAAMFAGASRAVLTSVVFAFETTRQPMGLLPLLAGCSAAHLVSCLLMRHSIMTERIARRGVPVPFELAADTLGQVLVGAVASRQVTSLQAGERLAAARAWLASGVAGTGHGGFPVLEDDGRLVGVVSRRHLLDGSHDPATVLRDLVRRRPVVVYQDSTLREAADQLAVEGVGRLAVVRRDDPLALVGFLTRSDLATALKRRMDEGRPARHIDVLGWVARLRRRAA